MHRLCLPATTPHPPPTTQGHTDAVCSVCFSPDGKYVASASWDNTVRISAVSDGSLVQEVKVCVCVVLCCVRRYEVVRVSVRFDCCALGINE